MPNAIQVTVTPIGPSLSMRTLAATEVTADSDLDLDPYGRATMDAE